MRLSFNHRYVATQCTNAHVHTHTFMGEMKALNGPYYNSICYTIIETVLLYGNFIMYKALATLV